MIDLEDFKAAYEWAFKKDYVIDLASYLYLHATKQEQPEPEPEPGPGLGQNNLMARAVSGTLSS